MIINNDETKTIITKKDNDLPGSHNKYMNNNNVK